MFIKIFLSCYLVSFGLSVPLEHDYDLPAKYEFSYAVHDEHTGDIKSQQESRNGHTVQGRYELIDSDGYRRIVEYTADNHNGFNAIVHREPTDIKIPLPIQQQYSQKFLTSEGLNYPAPFTKVSYPSAISNIATSVHSQPNTIYHQLS